MDLDDDLDWSPHDTASHWGPWDVHPPTAHTLPYARPDSPVHVGVWVGLIVVGLGVGFGVTWTAMLAWEKVR